MGCFANIVEGVGGGEAVDLDRECYGEANKSKNWGLESYEGVGFERDPVAKLGMTGEGNDEVGKRGSVAGVEGGICH